MEKARTASLVHWVLGMEKVSVLLVDERIESDELLAE